MAFFLKLISYTYTPFYPAATYILVPTIIAFWKNMPIGSYPMTYSNTLDVLFIIKT